MIFHGEEKSIEQGACQNAGVLQAEAIDEGREPTAAIGEIHELVKVPELQGRLESLDLTDDEAKAFQNANNLFAIGGVADDVIHGQAGATSAAKPAYKLGIGPGLQSRESSFRTTD